MGDSPTILAPDDAAIAAAAQRLRAGDVVVFPTETVYGLGADTFNIAALERVYELKGRPWNNPLIAHVSSVSEARRLAAGWDDRCERLAARFWPGPLTLVVPKAAHVPPQATARLNTIALRCPAHEVALRLLRAFGGPISAPSANRSGRVSPTRAEHVAADFHDVEGLMILDGGPCQVGIESTVLELEESRARILRPGTVTATMLREVLGDVEEQVVTAQAGGPGTSPAHYAPRTPAELTGSEVLPQRLDELSEPVVVLCFDPRRVPPPHRAILMPSVPEAYAAALYQSLRQADAMRASKIIIEAPPTTQGAWVAIHDRLRRAAQGAPGGQSP